MNIQIYPAIDKIKLKSIVDNRLNTPIQFSLPAEDSGPVLTFGVVNIYDQKPAFAGYLEQEGWPLIMATFDYKKSCFERLYTIEDSSLVSYGSDHYPALLNNGFLLAKNAEYETRFNYGVKPCFHDQKTNLVMYAGLNEIRFINTQTLDRAGLYICRHIKSIEPLTKVESELINEIYSFEDINLQAEMLNSYRLLKFSI